MIAKNPSKSANVTTQMLKAVGGTALNQNQIETCVNIIQKIGIVQRMTVREKYDKAFEQLEKENEEDEPKFVYKTDNLDSDMMSSLPESQLAQEQQKVSQVFKEGLVGMFKNASQKLNAVNTQVTFTPMDVHDSQHGEEQIVSESLSAASDDEPRSSSLVKRK